MKYLCLVYLEPGALAALSLEEQAALDEASLAYDRELERRGHFIAASALQGVGMASTIRRRSGASVVLDGPFAETKEALAGFIFIEARDMAQALEIAQGIPVGRYGAIEVRPELDIG
ncbi:MAG: YciI family protein [Phenylobacterium sp.]|uniref:YciI family protein n=1 Tax=Phenylobacterium sp. TaxID=1871053 RepID=UPI0025F5EE63|nr:YciI family protein [Phenylobacterium sp.]MBI1198146.1 YciI family protein [Phenylobacterium sp.]